MRTTSRTVVTDVSSCSASRASGDDTEAVSNLMHLAAGSTAKHYNTRKERVGSMWERPYQCTVVQDGAHLLNCICYAHLNMVRARVVAHPSEWRWCGHDEVPGKYTRRRRLIMAEASDASLGAWLVHEPPSA